jgi:hypothetical protein
MPNFVDSTLSAEATSMATALKRNTRTNRIGITKRPSSAPRRAVKDGEFSKLLDAIGVDTSALGKSKYAFGVPAKARTRLTPAALAKIARAFRPA